MAAAVEQLTVRSRNLDAQAVAKVNAVVRGIARYFGTEFSTVIRQFRYLDHRCEKDACR